jgi:acyl-CoA reductase-like NAD-dependent aldehyde dehydrogenase
VVDAKDPRRAGQKVAAAAAEHQGRARLGRRCGMGPLVSDEQLDRVAGYVDIARDEGAELVAGGGARGHRRRVTSSARPCSTASRPDMRIAQEEVFGPVLAVQTFEDEDEAVALANDVSYGLAAAVWTRTSVARTGSRRSCRPARCGSTPTGRSTARCPSGATSSPGSVRELGPHAVEAYTQVKSVWVTAGVAPGRPRGSWCGERLSASRAGAGGGAAPVRSVPCAPTTADPRPLTVNDPGAGVLAARRCAGAARGSLPCARHGGVAKW